MPAYQLASLNDGLATLEINYHTTPEPGFEGATVINRFTDVTVRGVIYNADGVPSSVDVPPGESIKMELTGDFILTLGPDGTPDQAPNAELSGV